MKYVCLILSLVCLSACPPKPPIPPVPPSPEVDSDVQSTCLDLCRHLQDMKCKAGEPTAGGILCSEVCINVQTSGVISWDLSCRVRATTCDAVENCK